MLQHQEITSRIIEAFYVVYNSLGYGFLERVYENALALELRARGLQVEQQSPIKVLYRDIEIGEYYADLLVEGTVIVELKAAERLADEHFAQLINYLKATQIEVGLLLNFGPKPEVKRKVFQTARSRHNP